VSTTALPKPGFEFGNRIELNTDTNALRQRRLPRDSVPAGALHHAELLVDAAEPASLQVNAAHSAFKRVKPLGTIFLACVSASPARFHLVGAPPVALHSAAAVNAPSAFRADEAAFLKSHHPTRVGAIFEREWASRTRGAMEAHRQIESRWIDHTSLRSRMTDARLRWRWIKNIPVGEHDIRFVRNLKFEI